MTPRKKTYTIDVTRKNAEIVIDPASIPDGQVGISYGPVYLEASGGVAPYSWGHDIPPGLSLNAGAPARDGRQVFGSVTAGYENRQDGWLISPYGRLEASRSTLDGFTESGGSIYRLNYGDQKIDTLSGVLGLRLEYAMTMDWGVLKPRARLEYTHDFNGSSRISLGYTDIGTMPYGIDIDPLSSDYLTIGFGFDAHVGDSWNLAFDYRTVYGSGENGRDHTFAVKVGAPF